MRSATVLLSFLFLLAAQQPEEVRIRSGPYQRPAATIAVDANLVELAVIVRDHKGAPTGGFQESDFAVLDDSKKEKITFFSELRSSAQHAGQSGISAVTPPNYLTSVEPRYIALFFDDTHQGVAGFDRSRRAAEKLIADGLQPGDHIGVFTGSGAVMLDFTADTKILLSTLAAMRRHPESNSRNGFGACPTFT